MKQALNLLSFVACVFGAALVILTGNVQAQQVPIPKTAAEVPGPPPGTAMTKEYVQMVGRMAYLWGWPLVNSHNRRVSFGKAPELGLVGGIVPAAPIGQVAMLTNYISPNQTFIACPNQDVVVRCRVHDAGQRAHRLSGPGVW